ncbi:capsular polysaccharide biosynthesis protein Cap8F [Lacrimispora indolis]|nr:capsular polysaccharide biosynthesis protein Cap8F [[Clostridium] methoxybenzovorans]
MKILITGARGFIGKNLIAELENIKAKKTNRYPDIDADTLEILPFDLDTDPSMLEQYTRDCDFVFHLAGVNRPKDPAEYEAGNFGFTSILLNYLKKAGNKAPVMLASSIQAALDNPYGKSKKAGEDLLFDYGRENKVKVLIYRFPNVFGKWGRPNYNSAVATFCHNIANGRPIQINDPDVTLNLVYIDDVVEELIHALSGREHREEKEPVKAFKDDVINVVKINKERSETGKQFCNVPTAYKVKLGNVATLIQSFREGREKLQVQDMSDAFTKKLYATYLSYLPTDQFSYPLKMNVDERGSFTEFIRTPDRGQVSINISKPGITKGQHWHHTKNEKFLVVKGKGLIQFRKVINDQEDGEKEDVICYHVTGDKLEVVDIPTGYTHNIINEGEEDMITVMWANEAFDPEKPDTYFLEV